MAVAQTCPKCRGLGETVDSPCKTCRGSGLQSKRMEITVPIPPGVEDGMGQRINGGGDAGARGGLNGDLIVIFSVKSDKQFVRRGLHVYMEMDIPFSIAVLGGEVDVPTMWGASKMKIKKGTEGNTILRLRGKGVPAQDGRQGVQRVRVKIRIPKKPTKEQKKYLEGFAEVFD